MPATATYRITTAGARGGYGFNGASNNGQGRIVRGEFALTQGQKLTIVVGQQGQDRNGNGSHGGGGGGGSFVALGDNASNNVIQIVGAGGGGANAYADYGNGGRYESDGQGRSDNLGDVSRNWGGYRRNGAGITAWGCSHYACDNDSMSAYPFRSGARGGNNTNCYSTHGGFGGGGTPHCHNGGGGGGYHGGAGGNWASNPGDGGGSFIIGSAANPNTNVGMNNGHGYVTIQKL